jgi:hypothetical protein
LGECPIEFPTGWARELAGSPVGGLATVTWLEQDCAGIEVVRLGTDDGDYQIVGTARHGSAYFVKPNLIQGPVFSPDGRLAAAACSRWSWWAPGGDPETPSPGGRLKAGHLAVLDTATMSVSEHDVVTSVPAGWLPPSSDDEMMGEPEFADARTVRVSLPTGDVMAFDLG